jgi:fatty acid desaturase
MTGPELNPRPAGPVDDTGDGSLMLFVFTAAALISTAAVAVIAVVGAWWMLCVGYSIYLAMTATVVLTFLHVMTDRAPAVSERSSPTPGRQLEGRTHPQITPVTAR